MMQVRIALLTMQMNTLQNLAINRKGGSLLARHSGRLWSAGNNQEITMKCYKRTKLILFSENLTRLNTWLPPPHATI